MDGLDGMKAREDQEPREAAVVLSTFTTEEEAAGVGRALLERRLVACVNLVRAVRSLYRWQGQIEDQTEVLAVMKTRRDRLPELLAVLPTLHPYQVPEILALKVAGGGASYLNWLGQESAPAQATGEGG
jgi:periplasmic divalent cation tolerance protein